MRARAHVAAEADGRGGTRLAALRSEPPLVFRSTPEGVFLVGGAAGPIGGDVLAIDVEVGGGATLTVRTAAASLALPGAGGAPSSVHVRARVAAHGQLRWLPEPVVAVVGCRHHLEASITLEEDARLVWREELVLGRHGEHSGSVRSRSTVDLGGAPLLRQELALGPSFAGGATPAVAGDARCVGSMLVVGSEASGLDRSALLGPRTAVLPLAGGGLQVVALADDAVSLRRQLCAGIVPGHATGVWATTRSGTNGPC